MHMSISEWYFACSFRSSGEPIMWPTSLELLYSALCIHPEWLLVPLKWLPSRDTMRLNHFRKVVMKVPRLRTTFSPPQSLSLL
ncbi:uncharacterized protein BT62DRAFT_54865 [Guyanagaster necrorhizus]|uniref:Uncharacterized protein n=1 Tax=Guyanagaster necrorhizus TaxID=856835 RepID=A0A9P8AYU6_9AGAR|nr:uncharacterized protein BT62DRAFT_54865 [Guyanagaster necrorhizus MCA 3950]KAG7453259.1 hypothetical protein BT62DRAFT_54865 [Guyanagaster necrorhizus MCA 3950]